MSSTTPESNNSNQIHFRYASLQHRVAAHAVNAGLLISFLIVPAVLSMLLGYASLEILGIFVALGSVVFGLVWIWRTWGVGQNPGKQILKLRVVHSDTGLPATRGHMAIRELLIPMAVSFGSGVTAGVGGIVWYVLEVVFYFNKGQRTLTDHWAKTVVINEA
jgi:uncharacterized RDD family membrane protein YckC